MPDENVLLYARPFCEQAFASHSFQLTVLTVALMLHSSVVVCLSVRHVLCLNGAS